jgi:hypothetical protein
MSSITPVESMDGYMPDRYEEKRDEINPAQDQSAEQLQAPEVKAAAEQKDFNTTVQGFKYTGKGSFIDHVF